MNDATTLDKLDGMLFWTKLIGRQVSLLADELVEEWRS